MREYSDKQQLKGCQRMRVPPVLSEVKDEGLKEFLHSVPCDHQTQKGPRISFTFRNAAGSPKDVTFFYSKTVGDS